MCGSLRNNKETFIHRGKTRRDYNKYTLLFLDLGKEKYHF